MLPVLLDLYSSFKIFLIASNSLASSSQLAGIDQNWMMSEISSNMTSIVPDNNRKRHSKKRGPADKIMLAPLF